MIYTKTYGYSVSHEDDNMIRVCSTMGHKNVFNLRFLHHFSMDVNVKKLAVALQKYLLSNDICNIFVWCIQIKGKKHI